ncbi:MAG: UvrD-helicase domain-containing protein [Cryomorphaceae bacterium]|nr:UvrD-helicase domain-containing protein [Cryomorphaceae bacterium]
MDYSFKIINSSAGSGKTFNLATEYIAKLLKSEDEEHFKSMLALTFTNKASIEMKDRILIYLSDLKYNRNKIIQEIISKKTGLNQLEIEKKSSNILDKILYNYSNFNVITIDSFTNNIIKSVSEELNNKDDYNIELDNSVYLDQAIEELFSDIDKEEKLKELLIEFAKFKLTLNKSWDISYDLKDFGLFIDKESNRIQVDYFKKMNFNFFSKIKKKLHKIKNDNTSNIHHLALSSIDLINNNGLDDNDFRGGFLNKYLKSFNNEDTFFINDSIEKSLKGETNLYNKTLEKSKVERIEKIRINLLNNYLKIKESIIDIYKVNSTLSFLPSLSLISRIEEKIEHIQSDNKIRLISKFNSQLNVLIKSNEAPYIYEKLGSRYTDFFIDEFQDTSELQWQNLIPLISNSIHSESHDGSKGSLLIVGDPKQSIYRWRGGKFNQFINLIYDRTNPFHFKPILKNTDINYRSCKEIVDFNLDFFNYLSEKLNIEIYNSDDLNFNQYSHKKQNGYVAVDVTDENSFYSKIENQILELLNRGYSTSDIIILVRKNKYSKELIENIKNPKFKLISNDILQIKNSENVQFIISIFNLSQNNNDYSERKKIINFLFTKNYFDKRFDSLNECFFINLSKVDVNGFFQKISTKDVFDLKHFSSLNILDAIKYCAFIFKLEIEDPYLIALIDDVFEFLDNNDDTIKSYLSHWKIKSDNINLSVSDDQHSINISTIHKSKGLEFPVVISPIYSDRLDENTNKDLIWLYEPFESLNDLKWTLTRKSKILLNMGDTAKEIFESEILNNLLDSINLLYVAFTRAEKELYVISKKDNPGVNTFSSLIQSFLDYKSKPDQYSIGEKHRYENNQNRDESNSNNIQKKKINIISTSKNVNQAKYLSDTLSKIYSEDSSAKVYVFFANQKLVKLVDFYDNNKNLKFTSNYHLFDSKISTYDHVIITNMNEGFFPFSDIKEGVLSNSEKIEFDEMSQYDQENKISKIFYELINKSKEIHLIYDSDLKSFMSGEESRYIKQLELLKTDSYICNRQVIEQKIKTIKNESPIILKDSLIDDRIESILKTGISASTLNLFIKNPYFFYEQKILNVNDFEESKYLNYMDQGTLIHKVIEKIYEPYIGIILEVKHLDSMKENLEKESINSFVELYSKQPQGKNLIFIEVLKEYINNTLEYEKDQLKNQNAQIKIISLEKKVSTNITVNNKDVKLNGIIDRIDMFNGGLRVIDYKSGLVNQGVLDLKNIGSVKTDHKYSYLLQLLFYKYLAESSYKNQEISEIGICSLKKRNSPFMFVENQSTLSSNEIKIIISEVITDILETNEFIDSGNPL